MNDVVMNSDGSTVLVGSSEGEWNAANAGSRDFAAAKLSADGELIWKWQVRTSTTTEAIGVLSVGRLRFICHENHPECPKNKNQYSKS